MLCPRYPKLAFATSPREPFFNCMAWISIIISPFCDFEIGHDGYIVTNDQYRDHIQTFEGAEREQQRAWAKSRLVSFTFVGDEFLPNPMKNIR